MKVTVQEEAVLVRLAEEAGVSVPRLLVEAAVAGGSAVTSTQRREAVVELLAVSRVLAGVATNLNQLARAVNSGAEFPPQAAVVREKIRELIPRLARAAEDLRDPANTRPLDLPPGRRGSAGLRTGEPRTGEPRAGDPSAGQRAAGGPVGGGSR